MRTALPDQAVVAAMMPYNVVRRGPGVFHRGSSGTMMIERERVAGQQDATKIEESCKQSGGTFAPK